MFFVIPFRDLQAVAYARWNPDNTEGVLHVITTRSAAENLLKDLPVAEADSLKAQMYLLKQVETDPSTVFDGNVALSLSMFIATYVNVIGEYSHITQGPELLGCWDPPAVRNLSPGIIMWFDPKGSYKVSIIQSKEQAKHLIKELAWLSKEFQVDLIKRIHRWNAPLKSAIPIRIVGGSVAELLCRASIAQKAVDILGCL